MEDVKRKTKDSKAKEKKERYGKNTTKHIRLVEALKKK
jgi:hypothetical protein